MKESIKLEGGHKMSEKEKIDLGKPNKDLKGRTGEETNQDGRIREKKDDSFVCPVCGKLISGKYLPDIQGYIEERLYSAGGFRVISQTILECDFEHFYDQEKDEMLEERHSLVATVETAFDTSGKCHQFNILEIRPAQNI
ncbi:MAG: hypothetical protein HXS46_02195 [Theionarchaea archaeon]|nr:MAG: hypothetical protein AYK18_14085 [Theionarchaea archaeon DG-70]MBU7009474.1 hypothetical protein [Theionarchaea archaeon]